MEVPLAEYTLLDLERELYAFGKETTGSKQERYERLLAARQDVDWSQCRLRKPAIAMYGARVQLDDFAQIRAYAPMEYDIVNGKVCNRLQHVRRTEDGEALEYFRPEVLSDIDTKKTYLLHMEEFMVRQEPYVHKIFVIFRSTSSGKDHQLCYARSLAKLRSWDEHTEEFEWPLISDENMGSEDATTGILQTTLMSVDNIVTALIPILAELKAKGLQNYVAIIGDQHRLSLAAVQQLLSANGHQMPPSLPDVSDLQRIFRKMFCSACVRCTQRLQHELYKQESYQQQLNSICSANSSKNMNAVLALMDYVNRLSGILLTMWHFEEHKKSSIISLLHFNNHWLMMYAQHVKRELPPITFEDCAAGAGLLQLLVFDELFHLKPEPLETQ